ncbi:RagB/SusD family nutrient uptake outer membrane protein [Pedobacter yulinensis]|uniref:RagB/SusD family nutrient uptake outer membrane protein n=1 Tax=Pedobacter yulinensis TaxID=2126353 RepID=A0A2T3HPZ5_9SPHI|nr:RagB/SusD family nutrient uptake outer membrane protein [Pedobacter yulinensis]PST84496.1 RagB/SusD family nutrient uptake outer membrane protein [Pedobacter yulinensis]
MKKNTIYLFTCLCLLAVAGCTKDEFLDKQPEADVSPDAFFKTENDLLLYTNSFYNTLPGAEAVYAENIDNIVTTSLSEQLTGRRVTPVTGGGWSWGNLRNINYFLENYARHVPYSTSRKYAAIARFFRAYFYYDKVKTFGDVPWYANVIKEDDQAALTKPRDPRTLVMDSVLADINYAIANLGNEQSVERITKWTALALKARLCLFEGTFRKYHTEFNLPDHQRFLTEGAQAAEELISSGPYGVYTSTPDKAYGELFSSLRAKPNEIILARRFSDALQIWHNVNYYTLTSSYGRPGLEKQLVESYLMKDGSRFTDIPGYQSMQFFEEVQNRDPRLSQTIRTPGYTRIGGAAPQLPQFGASTTGYQLIKFVGDVKYDVFNRSENDMPLFRMGEVYLNFAEAKAELGTLTQADLDKSLNKLRERVGMPHLVMATANASPDPFLAGQYLNVSATNKGVILEIRRERRIELVMESFRWDDLMRWKEGKLLTRQFRGMYFTGPGQFDLDRNGTPDVQIYTGTKPGGSSVQLLKLGSDVSLANGEAGGTVVVNPQIKKVFDENKDYLAPLPIQDLQLNPNLKQNPGWN